MRSPQPPEPERAAEVRRRFADEARAERPDLAVLCLLVGAAADGALDEAGMDAAQIELDRLAGQLPFRPGGPRSWAAALGELLGGRCGFRGSPGDYQRLESSLLHEVLRRRRGLPILLSVVWMEVARRAGAPVYGVALPGHFVVGFGPPTPPQALGSARAGDTPFPTAAPQGASLGDFFQQQVLADPFDGGRVLTGSDAELLVAGATGAPLDPSMLSPADPLDVVLRILNNIRAWAAARPERSDVSLWSVELSLLLPSHPARLRYERAQLLVQRGDFLGGAAELEAYADVVAAVDEPAADRVRQQAHAARAMLN
ncbi:tetratricopeptide repeat protein [Streptomyces sp. NPDC001530]|uniref:transglutaminase family protein n=1 Tax=Streptomyces sp. NPDC001530 TaxID=3364582 RepID=UPI00367B188C